MPRSATIAAPRGATSPMARSPRKARNATRKPRIGDVMVMPCAADDQAAARPAPALAAGAGDRPGDGGGRRDADPRRRGAQVARRHTRRLLRSEPLRRRLRQRHPGAQIAVTASIAAIDGVAAVETRIVEDRAGRPRRHGGAGLGDARLAARLSRTGAEPAVPAPAAGMPEPGSTNEAVVSEGFAKAHGLRPGDDPRADQRPPARR